MTIDEARTLLGVTVDTPRDEVRKAYTRAIKKHKPDKDPDGFRRAREAYELLESAASASASAVEALAAGTASAGVTPDAAEDAAPAPPLDAALLEARRALSAKLATSRDPEWVGASIDQHLRSFPADDGARAIAIEAFEACGRNLDALRLAREGLTSAKEPIHFLRELAQMSPRDLDASQVETLRADPRSAPWAVSALTALGRLDDAQTLAFDALASAAPETRTVWLRAIASMYEQGGGPLARAIMREVDRRMPDDVRRTNDPARIPTLLLRELGDVAGELDKDLVRTLGAFVLAPSRGTAMLTGHPPASETLTRSKALLRSRAPTLTSLAFPELEGRTYGGGGSPLDSLVVRRVGVLALMLLFTLLRQVACAPPHPPAGRTRVPDVGAARHGGSP